MAADNKTLGRFALDGIAPAPRGIPQIEVTFDIDANGILHVTAKDKATGKEQKISIKNATNLSDDEVQKMKQEAEKFADEDKKKKELVEKKNEAETFIFTTRKVLKDAGDKFDSSAKDEIEEALKTLEEEKNKPDISLEDLAAAYEKASTIAQKHGEALYKAASETGKKDEKSEEKPAEEGESKAEEGEVVK